MPQASCAFSPVIVRPRSELHHRGAAADRRHRALVAVGERLRLLARDPVRDRLAGVLSGLQRDRPELRQDLAGLRVGDRGHVAEHVHLGVVGQGEIRADGDAVAALQLEPERLDELVALQPGAPDQRVRVRARRPTSA